jgi:superfamily I DNA/RNA helicase
MQCGSDAQRRSGSAVQLLSCAHAEHEASVIVDLIESSVERGEAAYSDFAILYRTKHSAVCLEQLLQDRHMVFTALLDHKLVRKLIGRCLL